MEFTGKRTERVLMRVTPDMASEVRALAELEHRTIQDQFRFLIASALQQRSLHHGNGTPIPPRRAVSTRPFAEEKPKDFLSTRVAGRS